MLGFSDAGALGEPGRFHVCDAFKQVGTPAARYPPNGRVLAQGLPAEARGAGHAVNPLGLHSAPEPQDGHVAAQEVELQPLGDNAGCTHARSQAREALELARVGVGEVRLERLGVIVGSGVELVGGEELRQPPQFPDLPLAPLAAR